MHCNQISQPQAGRWKERPALVSFPVTGLRLLVSEAFLQPRSTAARHYTFYNAIPWQYRKDEVEKWARKAYPELWAELESFGDVIDEEWEIRYFKIDRHVDVDDELLFGAGEYTPVIAQDSQQMLNTPVGT